MYTDEPKPWEDLRNAVVLSAVFDYKKLLRMREKVTLNYATTAKKDEICAKIAALEKFFTSNYFFDLAGINGRRVILHAQEVIANEQKRSAHKR